MARGSVYKIGKRWYYHYSVKIDGKFKQIKRSAGDTKTEADLRLRQALVSLNPETKVLFETFVKEWLEDNKPHISENTYIGYSVVINNHLIPEFGYKHIHKITTKDLDQFINQKLKDGYKKKTVKNMVIVIRLLFKQAKIYSKVENNSAININTRGLKEVKQEIDFLKPDEIMHLLEYVKPALKVFFIVAVTTGLRISELLALRWSDIDHKSNQIYVRGTKTKDSNKPIKVAASVLDVVKTQPKIINPDNLIFVNKAGKKLDRTNIVIREFKPGLRKAGLRDVTFHSLRHSYNAMLLSSGANLRVIQEQMRHAYLSKTTLQDYGHTLERDTQSAADNIYNQVFGKKKVRKISKV